MSASGVGRNVLYDRVQTMSLLCEASKMQALIIVLSLLSSLAYGAEPSDWSMTVYGGHYTDDSLRFDILSNSPIAFEDSYMGAVAVTHIFSRPDPAYQWELEGQLAKHWGEQNNWEYNLLVTYRWNRFPWNSILRTTAAIGNGISYASEVPSIEDNSTYTGSSRLLDYLLLETTFAPPMVDDWALVMRIHHRSGMMGAIDGVIGGSNVICVGLRFDL